MSPRARWETKVRRIEQLESFEFESPSSTFDHHQIFDLITRVLLGASRGDGDRDLRLVVGHGLAALGFESLAVSRVWRDEAASRGDLEAALRDAADPYDREMLDTLWRHRSGVAKVLLGWDNLIEGHPVLRTIPVRTDRADFAAVADGVLATALQSRETMNRIDDLVLKIWGVAPSTPAPTVGQLARVCPSVLELNGLYSAEEFAALA